MAIKEEKITAIVDDLKARKAQLEKKEVFMTDVPTNYVAEAIYTDVIKRLQGLVNK